MRRDVVDGAVAAPALVVMAAGMGSRYGGSKQTEPVGPSGEMLMEYSLYDALAVGFRRIVFVVRREQAEAFRRLLPVPLLERCEIVLAFQENSDVPSGCRVPEHRDKPWGTGHAVLAARHAVDGPFAVINADDFYGRESFERLAAFHRETKTSEYALVGFQLLNTLPDRGTVSRGVCNVDENGVLLEIAEHTRVSLQDGVAVSWDDAGAPHAFPSDAVASMNMWAFPRVFLLELEKRFVSFLAEVGRTSVSDEFYLPSAVSDLMAEREARVRVLPTAATWMGMTYREDILRVRSSLCALVEAGIYPRNLWDDGA